MQRHLSDLDELLEGVRDSRSQEYLSEAINTYRTGAYRSAVIATWVAVCIDIIGKIRKLSNEGHPHAKLLETELNDINYNNVGGFQKYENSLLTNALEKLAIISSHECKLLERIKEDRNFCAHPNFHDDGQREKITAEGARAHIVNACNALLLHAPIGGKVLIERLQNLIAENSFPADDEKAFAILESEHYLGNAHDFVARDITNDFLEQIFQEEHRLPESQEERIFAALHAISRLKSDAYKKALERKLPPLLSHIDSERLKRIFLFPDFLLPNLWPYIDNPTKLRINTLVLESSIEDIITYKIYPFAKTMSDIKIILDPVIENLTPNDKLRIVASFPMREFKDLAMETFILSGSYDGAYSNGRNYLLPHAQYFDADDLRRILTASITNSQILPARGMEEVFVEFFNKTKQNIPEYTGIWSEFWSSIEPRYGISLPIISAHLTAEGVIPAQPAP